MNAAVLEKELAGRNTPGHEVPLKKKAKPGDAGSTTGGGASKQTVACTGIVASQRATLKSNKEEAVLEPPSRVAGNSK